MPNRYVREGIITSEAVNSLSWQAEVFYRRLLNTVDDFGRFTAHPELLRAATFPMQLNRVRETDIPRLLAECEKAGLVYVYADRSKPFLVLNNWEKGRAKVSKWPEPPAPIQGVLTEKPYLASGGKFSGDTGGLGEDDPTCAQDGSRRSQKSSVSDSDPDSDKEINIPARARGLPRSEDEAVNLAGVAPGIPEAFIRSLYVDMVGVGFKNGTGVAIESWPHYVAGRWKKEQDRLAEKQARSEVRFSKSRTETTKPKSSSAIQEDQIATAQATVVHELGLSVQRGITPETVERIKQLVTKDYRLLIQGLSVEDRNKVNQAIKEGNKK